MSNTSKSVIQIFLLTLIPVIILGIITNDLRYIAVTILIGTLGVVSAIRTSEKRASLQKSTEES